MNLKDKLSTDLNTARKNGDTLIRETLSLVIGELRGAEKSGKTPKDFNDEEVQKFLAKQVKTRRESAEIYKQQGSDIALQRAANENAEADILSAYLPQPLSENEVQDFIEEAIQSFEGELSMKAMGSIMKNVNARVKGRFDGKRISEMVRARLG